MNKYELALVVNAKAEDDVRTATVEKAKEYIARYGGVVTEVEDWGKKRLAYPINDETEGVYTVISFTSEPDFPAELDRVFKITEGVLRSMTLAVEE